jgi:hypothetical protein
MTPFAMEACRKILSYRPASDQPTRVEKNQLFMLRVSGQG